MATKRYGKAQRKTFNSRGWTAEANPDRAMEQIRTNERFVERIAVRRRAMGYKDSDANTYVSLEG